MRTSLLIIMLFYVLGLSAGCHSGIMRGTGSDLSKLGNNMQK